MTHLNNQVISSPEKTAIAETVHETLCEFRDELKRDETSGYTDILEGSCFYYAALGAEVCTKFYRQINSDLVSYYTLDAGYFALRPYKDKTQESKSLIYSGEISDNKNDYHCWIVGPVPLNDKRKLEIIDFTARHYKVQVDKKADLNWEREDLEDKNFIWSDNYVPCEFKVNRETLHRKGFFLHEENLVFGGREDTLIKIRDDKWNKWRNCDLRVQMMKKSDEILSYKLRDLSKQ